MKKNMDGCHIHKGYFSKTCGFCDLNSLKAFDRNIKLFLAVFGPRKAVEIK